MLIRVDRDRKYNKGFGYGYNATFCYVYDDLESDHDKLKISLHDKHFQFIVKVLLYEPINYSVLK